MRANIIDAVCTITFSTVYKTVSRYIFESENKIVGLSDDGRIATWPRGIGQQFYTTDVKLT